MAWRLYNTKSVLSDIDNVILMKILNRDGRNHQIEITGERISVISEAYSLCISIASIDFTSENLDHIGNPTYMIGMTMRKENPIQDPICTDDPSYRIGKILRVQSGSCIDKKIPIPGNEI